jgi:hypothetical protein
MAATIQMLPGSAYLILAAFESSGRKQLPIQSMTRAFS